MMPFVLDDEMSLPMEFRPYWEMIEQCTLNLENNKHCEEEPEKDLEKDLEKDQKGEALWALDISSRIAYLTVDERNVIPGDSHRRGGLHTEAPGTTLTVTGAASVDEISIDPDSGQTYPPRFHGWGIGMIMKNRSYRGGIFMASTVDDSCAVYNARVRRPEVDSSGFMKKGDTTAVGLLGDCEHLRPCAQHTRRLMKANELVWMTDTTLHESLPLKGTKPPAHIPIVKTNKHY
eukprot:gene19059-33334_t